MGGISKALWKAMAALLRIIAATTIAVGLIQRLDPFPYRSISYWQARLTEGQFQFPGHELFFWLADHWLELSVAIALIQLARLTRAFNRAEA